MKKVAFVTAIVLLFLIFFFIIRLVTEQKPQVKQPQGQSELTPSPNEIKPEGTAPEQKEAGYTFSWLIVRDKQALSLYSNLEEKLTSADAKSKNGCLHLISGGSYTQENEHAGLFISEGNKIAQEKESSLFNGYFVIFANGRAEITKWAPSSPRLALQSGPILFEEKQPSILTQSSERARRVVVATTRDGSVVFLAVYDKNSVFEGPPLSELPNLLKNINQNTSLDIVDALNLDGGAHSAFLSGSLNLVELARIGSYFCVTEGFTIY